MSRLAIAILILIAVLLGLRFVSSPFFQENILNRIGSPPPIQTTGFSTTVPTDISQNTPIQPNRPETNDNSTNQGNTGNQGNTVEDTTPPRPIPGGW